MMYFVVYMCSIFLIFLIIAMYKVKVKPFPQLHLLKDGIYFNSTFQHKLKIDDASVMQIDNEIFLSKSGRRIVIKNATLCFIKNGYMFFKPLGNCCIGINTSRFYKYFEIIIKSKQFNLETMKQQALQDVLFNIFNINKCIKLKRFLHIVTNILKIKIINNKLNISQNKYGIPFSVEYVKNGKKKRVNINLNTMKKSKNML